MSFRVYGDLPEHIMKKAERIAERYSFLDEDDADVIISGAITDDRMLNLLDQLLTERAEMEGIEV